MDCSPMGLGWILLGSMIYSPFSLDLKTGAHIFHFGPSEFDNLDWPSFDIGFLNLSNPKGFSFFLRTVTHYLLYLFSFKINLAENVKQLDFEPEILDTNH